MVKQTISQCREAYTTPLCEATGTAPSELLCQSPDVNQENFGGFDPFDGWDA